MLLDNARVALEELVVLPDPVTRALARHLRARHVELDHVGAGLFGPRRQFDPSFVTVTHDAGDQDAVRVVLLEPGDVLKVVAPADAR